MLYRITSGRWDVPSSTYAEFNAADDETAKKVFREISSRKENSWETMFLYRVEQVEKMVVLDSVRVKDRDGYANDL